MKIGTVWKQTAATDLGMIESKQCEDELDLIISFDQIFTAGASYSVAVLEDERLEGKKRDGYSQAASLSHFATLTDRQVLSTTTEIMSLQPNNWTKFECSLSRNVPIQKFGCTIIVSTR